MCRLGKSDFGLTRQRLKYHVSIAVRTTANANTTTAKTEATGNSGATLTH